MTSDRSTLSRRIVAAWTLALAAVLVAPLGAASAVAPAAGLDDPVPGLVVPQARQPSAAELDAAMRRKIVAKLREELVNKTRNHDDGSNCNYYSGYLKSGKTCGNGRRINPWCVEMVRWIWRGSGADIRGLTYRPESFRSYGKKHGTWRKGRMLRGIKPGDVIIYDLSNGLGHGNSVVKVEGDRITVIGGNESNRTQKRTFTRGARTNVNGYVSPVRLPVSG